MDPRQTSSIDSPPPLLRLVKPLDELDVDSMLVTVGGEDGSPHRAVRPPVAISRGPALNPRGVPAPPRASDRSSAEVETNPESRQPPSVRIQFTASVYPPDRMNGNTRPIVFGMSLIILYRRQSLLFFRPGERGNGPQRRTTHSGHYGSEGCMTKETQGATASVCEICKGLFH